MPIHCPINLAPLTDAEFEAIDQQVMGACYAAQNHLSRLCDEQVYENDLAARLQAQGVTEVRTQVPVTLTHEAFFTHCRLDLVVGRMICELKTAAALAPEQGMQAIHHAALGKTDRV
jgi:GxxExxY protein